jgi:cellulose synthase operon protein C
MNSFKLTALALAISSTLTLVACKKADTPEALISSAKSAIEGKDPRAAEIHLKNLLQLNQQSGEGRYLLGKLYSDAGDFRAAEKELRRSVEAGYDRNISAPLLLESMFQLGEMQKIVDESANLAADQPQGKAEILNIVGRALYALGKKDDAKARFEEAVKVKSDFIPGYVSLVQMRAANGDRPGALLAIDNVLKQYPDSPEALAMKGDLTLSEGKLAEAKEMYAKVVKTRPTDSMSRAKLAAILIDLQDYPNAKLELTELGKLSPNSPGTLHLKALYEFRNNNLVAAQEFVQAALRVAPEYLPAVSLAGNVYLANNSLEQAERAGRTLIERQPNALQGYRLLAATYLKMGQPERALSTVQPMIDRGVDDATLLAIAGEATLKSNDPAKAAQYFERASKLDPKDAGKRTGLALSKMAIGNKDGGYNELEAAVSLDSQSYQADFALIMARMRDKEYDKALEAVSNLEKKQTKSAVPLNLRGMILTAKGDFEGATASFEGALKIEPAFFPAAANLASLDLRANKPAEAKKRYEGILVKDPKNYQAYIALAKHASRYGGTKDEILGYLQKGKNNNPGIMAPVLALSAYYIDNNTPKEAIPLLQESLQQNPDKSEVLDLLGMAFLRANERTQALETYDKMLKLDPKSAALHFRMGELKSALRDDAGALSSFRSAAELQPKALEPQIAIASMLLKLGKKTEARQVATALQKDLPNNPAGLILSGDLAMAESNFADAASNFKKAIALQKSPQVTTKLHAALVRNNAQAEADTVMAGAVKDFPEDLGIRLFAGENAITTKKWPDAIEHYKVALKRDSNNGVALNNMAWAMYQMNDPKAVQIAELAYAAMPQNPAVMDTLGFIYVKSGNPARGLELLRQAAALAPKSPEIRLHLADAMNKTGDKDGAKREIDTVLKDFPTGPANELAKQAAASL